MKLTLYQINRLKERISERKFTNSEFDATLLRAAMHADPETFRGLISAFNAPKKLGKKKKKVHTSAPVKEDLPPDLVVTEG